MTRPNPAHNRLPIARTLPHSALASRPSEYLPPMAPSAIHEIETRLGGSDILRQLGVRSMFADHTHVSFAMLHPNPMGVKTVVITAEPSGDFHMDCYGSRTPGYLSAPLVASAGQIVPENLATVLGQLTGIEAVHHHHY